MLKILYKTCDLDFSEMLSVYSEAINDHTVGMDRLSAEQQFYDDLSLFLSAKDAMCCVWVIDSHYVSSVRCEEYNDGFLLTCLETSPLERRKGYAYKLISSLLAYLCERNVRPVFVHIHNHNKASLALHKKLGFRVCSDSARLVDGTVSTSYCTMMYS